MHILQTVFSGFANIANQLIRLTGEMRAFQWTPEVEAAFQTLYCPYSCCLPEAKREVCL
jgi:hypothetical protein